MSVTEIKLKIAAAADQLDEARALQLLEFAQKLLHLKVTSGRDLLKHAGSIDEESARQMLEVVCESRQIHAYNHPSSL